MLKCDPRVFARCPYQKSCIRIEEAEFAAGSDCDVFNQRVLAQPITVADDIRAKSDPQLFLFLYMVIASCKSHNCEACPIGPEKCQNLKTWLKSESEGGN